MSNSIHPRRSGVRRIAINGRFLDEIQTRLQDDRSGSLIHTSYLYHDGILPANREQSVDLTVADRRLGAFFVQWLRGL